MQAMLARVTEPVAYQAFQHFITHAPWDADRVWRRLRAVVPERRGVLILDGTSFPKQGPHSVGVARQYLWRAGQDCQLPSGGDRRAVDGRARVVSRRPLYLPDDVADARPRAARADSGLGRLSREMAPAADLAAAGARGGFAVTAVLGDAEFGDVTGFGHAASAAAALRARDFVDSDGLSATRPRLARRIPDDGRGRPAHAPPRDRSAPSTVARARPPAAARRRGARITLAQRHAARATRATSRRCA